MMKKKSLLNRKKPDWFWPVLAIVLIIVIVAIVLIVKNQTEDNAILSEDNLLSDNSDDPTSRTLVGQASRTKSPKKTGSSSGSTSAPEPDLVAPPKPSAGEIKRKCLTNCQKVYEDAGATGSDTADACNKRCTTQ